MCHKYTVCQNVHALLMHATQDDFKRRSIKKASLNTVHTWCVSSCSVSDHVRCVGALLSNQMHQFQLDHKNGLQIIPEMHINQYLTNMLIAFNSQLCV